MKSESGVPAVNIVTSKNEQDSFKLPVANTLRLLFFFPEEHNLNNFLVPEL